MKILSIDVGIKNLALCLFYIESKDKYEILKWDVVSLCNEKIVNCSCGKPAKYQYDETKTYYCKNHCKTMVKTCVKAAEKNIVKNASFSYRFLSLYR